jgi:ubiquinone/menaquinone biosynthesis C-methylase UbiE
MPERGHPIFAAFYDRMMASAERKFLGAVRREIVGAARGRVLEIGCGTGASFPYYSADASSVAATEPDPFMAERARRRAVDAGRPIDLQEAPAEALPFPDASFDSVVSMLVLCTVADPAQSLAEIHRVLRPGGELRFYEHVRFRHAFGAFWQDLAAPLWRRVAAGCHPNRDTEALIRGAGFAMEELVETTPVPPIPPVYVVRAHIRGVARTAGAAR